MGHSRFALLVFFVAATATWGQSIDSASATTGASPAPSPVPQAQADDDSRQASANPVKFVRNLARDQKDIWTSPFKAKIQDLNWIIPLAGVSAGLINADAELSRRIDTNNSFSRHSSTIANAGVGLLLGGSGGL